MSRLGALVLAVPLLAPAGDERQSVGPGLEARVWSPWPASVHKGWAPVYVEVRNDTERERRVELEAACHDRGSERRVHAQIELAPGARGTLELLVPLGGLYSNQYMLQVRGGTNSAWFGDVGGSSSANPMVHQVVLLDERALGAGTAERWSADLSDIAVEQRGARGGRVASGGAPGPPANNVELAHARFDDMPNHHAAYSSLDLVLLDSTRGMPTEAQLAPLVAWVQTGGDLMVLGERASAACAAVPALAAWMEPRFASESAEARAFRCGLGRLHVAKSAGEPGDAPIIAAVRTILGQNGGLVPEGGNWRGMHTPAVVPGVGRLPYRAFALLLILFALAIGPFNFFYTWKKKRPVLLLVTIPTLALAATLALLAYGLLFQGLGVKSASHSVAVLDQRAHRSACVELRQFFAGLSPAAGLALGPGTVVHAIPRAYANHSRVRERFEVELAGGTLLAGDFLPPRTLTSHVLAVERAERARLDVRRSGAHLVVANNLGADIEGLVVRDPAGRAYVLRGSLAPGASTELVECGEPEADGALEFALTRVPPPQPLPDEFVLPPGCYLARLVRSPFRDDCGIEMDERESRHVVLGVLALDEEGWR